MTVQVSDGRQTGTADVTVTLSNVNEAPTASAGTDQTEMAEGATVTLSGTGTDPDAGDTLSYAWTKTAGPAVTLSGADTATATFTAPTDLTADAVFTFKLTVTDAGSLSATDTVSVTVEAPERAAPAVTGTTAFTVAEGATAVGTLTATDTDTDADDLTWSITGGADQAKFAITTAGVLSFKAAKDYESPDDTGSDGSYAVTVQVSDGAQTGTADLTVTLSNVNEAPTANAGTDQTEIAEGATVTLSGTGTDPDAGDTLSYAWTKTAGPAVTLSGADKATATFTAPSDLTADAVFTFKLTVTDADSLSATDTVSVTVEATERAAPAVTGTTAFTVAEGATAVGTLTATDTDTDADDLTWSITGGADQAKFAITTAGVLSFKAAKDYESPDDTGSDGSYAVTVQVSDGAQTGTADLTVTLSNVNEAPTANAGTDQTGVAEGATVTLSGSGTDPDAGDTLSYAWTKTAGPAVTLSNSDKATATFAAPTGLTADATFTFRLTVTDAGSLSATDTVSVTVEAPERAALTARVQGAPERHGGSGSQFRFELHFSEEPRTGFSYLTLRDSAFAVTGGAVVSARRQSPPSNQSWFIDVQPDSNAAVTLVLPAGRACDATGAICTEDGRSLSNRLELTVAGPAPAPLTARVEAVPASHAGTAFTFRLIFNQEIPLSYVTLREHSFAVTGGSVTRARRLAPPSNVGWEITVRPDSSGEVRLVLASNRACDTAGAICTAQGDRLSNRLEITVPGQP